MKIVNPNNSNHSIVLIPRQYAYSSLQMELYNEFTQVKEIVAITHLLEDGLLTINFSKSFQEGQTFQIKITDNNGLSFNIDPQLLMKQQQNKFLGWDCNIGSFTMRIDHDVIYRGVCEEGEKRSIYEDISFIDNYIPCKRDQCFCGTDMIATKILPESNYPLA